MRWHKIRTILKMKRTVLIVDDEIDLCVLIKNYLGKKDCQVYIAHSLQEGIRKLETIKTDVLFLDNNLPDGTGWKEAQNIHSRFPDLHINLMSAVTNALAAPVKTGIPFTFRILEKPMKLSDMEDYLG